MIEMRKAIAFSERSVDSPLICRALGEEAVATAMARIREARAQLHEYDCLLRRRSRLAADSVSPAVSAPGSRATSCSSGGSLSGSVLPPAASRSSDGSSGWSRSSDGSFNSSVLPYFLKRSEEPTLEDTEPKEPTDLQEAVELEPTLEDT